MSSLELYAAVDRAASREVQARATFIAWRRWEDKAIA